MRLSYILAALIFATSPALADASNVTLSGYENSVLMPSASSGPYSDVIQALISQNALPLDYQTFPAKRTYRRMFETPRQSDCEFPSALTHLAASNLEIEDFIESDPINYVQVHILTRPGSTSITKLEQLEGYNLAYTRGFGYGPELADLLSEPNNLLSNKYAVESDIQGLRMLLLYNRVDAVLSYFPEALVTLREQELPAPVYAKDRPFFKVADRIVCHKSDKTIRLIEQVNKGLARMQTDDQLRKLLGELYLPGED